MSTQNQSKPQMLALSAALSMLALSPLTLQAAPRTPTANELFDWAQTALPAAFPGSLTSVAGTGFTFRGPYSTGNYLGAEGSTIYVLGPATGNRLQAVGALADFACSVHPGSCISSETQAKVTAFMAAQDALYASGLPATGAQAYANHDTCYFHNGVTRASDVARFDADADVRANLARRVGARRTDIEVLAERNTTNADGSARREIDVRYNLGFADGMVQRSITETLVQGSSAGTSTAAGACAMPQTSQDLRLATAPEFAGKPGNSLDPVPEDAFRICWTAGSAGLADAAVADCTQNGAEINAVRVQNTDAAALDRAFAALGFAAGGTYTLQVYADDGWKTVNGQAGKTPIATYQARLGALPESAAALAAGTTANYPNATMSLTPVDIATALRNKTAAAIQVTVVKPAKASTPLRLESGYIFEQGRVSASAAFPNVRLDRTTYPAANATSFSASILVPPQNLAIPTTGELGVTYNDPGGRSIRNVMSFD